MLREVAVTVIGLGQRTPAPTAVLPVNRELRAEGGVSGLEDVRGSSRHRDIGGRLTEGVVVERRMAVDRHAGAAQFVEQARRNDTAVGRAVAIEHFSDVVPDRCVISRLGPEERRRPAAGRVNGVENGGDLDRFATRQIGDVKAPAGGSINDRVVDDAVKPWMDARDQSRVRGVDHARKHRLAARANSSFA